MREALRSAAAVAAVLTLVASACERSPTEMDGRGSYALVSVSGTPLPVSVAMTGAVDPRLTAGSATIGADGRYALELNIDAVAGAVKTTMAGAWTQADHNTIRFERTGGAAFEGTVAPGGWMVVELNVGDDPSPKRLAFERR